MKNKIIKINVTDNFLVRIYMVEIFLWLFYYFFIHQIIDYLHISIHACTLHVVKIGGIATILSSTYLLFNSKDKLLIEDAHVYIMNTQMLSIA